jgi:hypothetical protein
LSGTGEEESGAEHAASFERQPPPKPNRQKRRGGKKRAGARLPLSRPGGSPLRERSTIMAFMRKYFAMVPPCASVDTAMSLHDESSSSGRRREPFMSTRKPPTTLKVDRGWEKASTACSFSSA